MRQLRSLNSSGISVVFPRCQPSFFFSNVPGANPYTLHKVSSNPRAFYCSRVAALLFCGQIHTWVSVSLTPVTFYWLPMINNFSLTAPTPQSTFSRPISHVQYIQILQSATQHALSSQRALPLLDILEKVATCQLPCASWPQVQWCGSTQLWQRNGKERKFK